MKKYTNTGHKQVCVQFESFAQFLRRGEKIECSEKVVGDVPRAVVVEEVSKKRKKK